jgi:hypothetical protein
MSGGKPCHVGSYSQKIVFNKTVRLTPALQFSTRPPPSQETQGLKTYDLLTDGVAARVFTGRGRIGAA